MPEAMDFLTSQDFHKLPLNDRLEVLRKDPNFSALNPKDQGEMVAKAQQKALGASAGQEQETKPEDAGFGTTLVKDIISAPAGIIQVVRHPLDTLSADKGARDTLSKTASQEFNQGQYLPAAGNKLASYMPFIGPQAAQAGEELGAGQYGQGSAHALEALVPFAGHAVGEIPAVSRFGRAVGAGAKVAAPAVAKGAALIGGGELLGKIPGMGEASRFGMGYPGARAIAAGFEKFARAFGDTFKGRVETPEAPKVTPPKGLNLAQLQEAVKSGNITHEQFEAELPKLGYDPVASKIISDNLKASTVLKSPIKFPVTSPKTLSLGQLQKAVGSGRMPIEDFTGQLRELGYTEEHANELTEQLKDSMKEDEESEGGDKTSKKPEKPKSSGPGEVKKPPKKKKQGPLSDEARQKVIDSQSLVPTSKPQAQPLNINKTIQSRDVSYHFTDPENIKGILQSGEINDRQGKSLSWGVSVSRVPEKLNLKGSKGSIALELDNDKIPPTKPKTEYNTKKSDIYGNYPNKNYEFENRTIQRRPIPSEAIKRIITTDPNQVEQLQKVSGDIPVVYIPKNQLSTIRAQMGKVLPPPSAEVAFTADEPVRPPITQQQIEESQSDARVAKETKLARHFIDNKVDLDNIPITSEYLRAIGNESGLKRTPSLRTLENAINRAKELKSRPKTE